MATVATLISAWLFQEGSGESGTGFTFSLVFDPIMYFFVIHNIVDSGFLSLNLDIKRTGTGQARGLVFVWHIIISTYFLMY
jgi:hypothetical protein